MATELGQAYVQIMPSAKGISGSIRSQLDPEALAAGKSAGSNIASSIANSLGDIGGNLTKKITLPAVAAATAVGGIVAAFGWKRLVGLDSAQAQLKGLGYAVADVERISDQVKNAVQGTTMTMAEGTSVAAGALAAGVAEGADLERYIKQVGNAAVGANRPIADMAQIFNRVQGSGKLMTQELNMIEDGMPGFAATMSESLGVTQAEFRKMVTEGKVSSEQFLDVMDSFAGEMSTAYADSWAGMVSNTKAWIGIIGESILGGVFEQSKEAIGEFMEYLKSDDIQTWAAETGAAVGEAFTKIIGAVRSAIEWWTGLSDTTKTVIKTLALLAVAIGPVLTIVNKMIGIVTKASHVFATLKVAAGVVGAAIGAITAPVAIAIAAITAIIAVGVLLYKNWDTIKEKANQLAAGLKATWENIKTSISNAINNIKTTVTNIWENIKTTTGNIWNGIRGTIDSILNLIKSTFSGIFNSLAGVVKNAFNNVKASVSSGMSSAWNTVTSFSSKFKTAGSNIVNAIAEGIRRAAGKATSAIRDVTRTIRNYLPFSPAKEGPLKDLHKLDFGVITDGIYIAKRPIENAMRELAQSALDSYDITGINHKTPGNAAQTPAAAAGGVMVTGNTFYVRSDNDIKRVAQELYHLQQNKFRGQGR